MCVFAGIIQLCHNNIFLLVYSDFLKGVGLPSWHQASISVALTAKRVQPLLYVVRPNSENKGTLKVKFLKWSCFTCF